MKAPTILRVLALLLVPVALSFPLLAAAFLIPWMCSAFGVDPKSNAAEVTCLLLGFALFFAPLCLCNIALDLEDKK